MGVNNSRLHGSGGEVLPARIRHRIEELRKQKSEVGTLSHKQLLNYDGVMEERKSQSSEENESEHNKGSPIDTRQAKHVEKISKVVPLPVSEEQRNKLHNEEKWGEVVKLKTEKVKSAGLQQDIKYEEPYATHASDDNEEEEDDEEDEEEEDEEDDIESERAIGPSSPSFKIYCTEAGKEGALPESKALGDKNQTVALFQQSPSAYSIESFVSASENTGNSNEMVEIKTVSWKRKVNKRKKFGAMKMNLIQVKNLHNRMNPIMACTGNDKRRILSDN